MSTTNNNTDNNASDTDPSTVAVPTNVSICRYKTQGTIASIDLMDKSFTIEPASPYAFEQKKGEGTEKFMLFVEDKSSAIKEAKILTCKTYFKMKVDVDLCAMLALKNGREKIELEVELKDDFDAGRDKLQVESLKTIK